MRRSLSEDEFRELMDDRTQEERGNWIVKDKDELKRMANRRGSKDKRGSGEKGILMRTVESFSINTDVRYSVNDYLRQLEPGMGFADIIKLEPESEYRTRSTQTKRYSIRSKIDPFTWMSLGGNVSMNNRFSKTAGTASNSDSLTVAVSENRMNLLCRHD